MNDAIKNNQNTKNTTELNTGIASSCYAFEKLLFGTSVKDRNQGTSGMGPESQNRYGSSIEKIIESGEKIVKAGNDRFILNVGDILPTNGGIYKVIELGRYFNG